MRFVFILFYLEIILITTPVKIFSQDTQSKLKNDTSQKDKEKHVKQNIKESDKILDELFKKGAGEFYRLIQKNISYVDREKIGTTIVIWQIENGEIINPLIINSLGEKFDNEISKVLSLTINKWVKLDTAFQFFLPIKFKHGGFNFSVDPFPENFLSEIIVIGYNVPNKNLTDDELVETLNNSLRKKKFNLSIQSLDRLIERNPLNIKLRESRIFCLFLDHRVEEACEDIAFLQNFLNHTSEYTCPSKN